MTLRCLGEYSGVAVVGSPKTLLANNSDRAKVSGCRVHRSEISSKLDHLFDSAHCRTRDAEGGVLIGRCRCKDQPFQLRMTSVALQLRYLTVRGLVMRVALPPSFHSQFKGRGMPLVLPIDIVSEKSPTLCMSCVPDKRRFPRT